MKCNKETVTKDGKQQTKLVDKEEIVKVNEEKQICERLCTRIITNKNHF